MASGGVECVRTPADRVPVPEPDENGVHDLAHPAYYLNRELTWLNFNFRVLQEAADPRLPVLERVRFLAIVSSNLDEFFMKRIGGLKQQIGAGFETPTVDGRSPQEQIDECYELIRELNTRRRAIFDALCIELEAHGIRVMPFEDLEPSEQEELRETFIESYYPLITPQATDPAHPFPFISNLSLNLLVTLRHGNESMLRLARVKVPVGAGVPRFLELETKQTFVPLESVMAGNLDLLFPGMVIEAVELFRVTRNANTERDEERADDLLVLIESELRDRKFAPIVRLEISEGMSSQHRGMLSAELGIDENTDVFPVPGMMGMMDFMELADIPRSELKREAHRPVDHPDLAEDRNIFHIIRGVGSILLHHPYVSFTTSVERLLREASLDPKVRAVKVCLYRTSEASQVVEHLIEAARNGKQVTVVVELKARFDEEANIRWASRLEEAGINVTYGVVGLKTHCKVVQIVRQDYDGLRLYAHVGTGNYHAGTARQYSDFGLITCRRKIGRDVTELLNYLTTGYKPKRKYVKIVPAPKLLKPFLLERIDREAENTTEKEPGLIQFKMNGLEDADIVRALYRASQAGVHVDLIVRDTCRLRPGVPGLSENICVISVVGRFLEHSRIYYFQNGGEEEYLIGSADLMRRNLISRVEVLVPVEEPALRADLRGFFDLQLADQRSVWDMRGDGSYVQRRPESDAEAGGCQERLIELHQKRHRRVTRLKRRKPRGFDRRRFTR